ncbi:hypothetical protein [Xylocopilactobacillus apicola]|uniref:MazF family toxin-antitoxin system n=1 Tax=Xylocopilactobacillus apicola TaxID=2932184 RepID=A0AAU9DLC4_9LACO|nr:MazF family toxin-antitoxin system [Xylocopilactobacillus apicola]
MTQMKTNEIVTIYVAFVEINGGKKRPVLIREINDVYFTAFKITSKYLNKSNKIKSQYYPIKNWQTAGLKQKSWVDIGHLFQFPKTGLTFKRIGKLSDFDQIGIDLFTKKFKENE